MSPIRAIIKNPKILQCVMQNCHKLRFTLSVSVSDQSSFSFSYTYLDILIILPYTDGPINLPIAAIAYFINTLDIQSPGRGRGGPNYFKVGGLFYKICTYLYANFRKKSHPIRPREGLKLCLDFLCYVLIQYFNFKEINEYFWNTRKKYHNNAIPHY